jgi:hypothetical protein
MLMTSGGTDVLSQTLRQLKHLITLLSSGGFHLGKRCSNCPSILETAPSQDRIQLPWKLGSDETVMTLRLLWHRDSKKLLFQFNIDSKKQEMSTKNEVLSSVASVCDPLELLGPVIVKCKMFVQRLAIEHSLG